MKNKLIIGAEVLGIDGMNDELSDRLLLFADELMRWNTRINLTSVRTVDEIIEKHLLDSLMVMALLKEPSRILDMGSGAGLPAIPLAMAMKSQTFYSVDSVGKKINFQKHIKRQYELNNLEIQCARVEELSQTFPAWKAFDVVLARAVAHIDDLLKMALPVIKPGGRLIAMKGSEGEKELSGAKERWSDLYEMNEKTIKYQLPFSMAQRCLLIIARKDG